MNAVLNLSCPGKMALHVDKHVDYESLEETETEIKMPRVSFVIMVHLRGSFGIFRMASTLIFDE